jgi:hypothetical protein
MMGIPDRRYPPPSMASPLSSVNATSNNPSSGPALNLEFDSTMVDNLQDLFLGRTTRFFGKYSGVMVHQATLQLKRDCISSSPGLFIADFPPSPLVSGMELLLKNVNHNVLSSSILRICLTVPRIRFQNKTSCNPSLNFTSLIRIFCSLCSIDRRLKNTLPTACTSPTDCLLRRFSLSVPLAPDILMILASYSMTNLRPCPVGGNGFPRFRCQETS